MNFKSTLIRILSIVTVAALLLSASGCGESKSGKKKVIKRVIITEESSEENITDISSEQQTSFDSDGNDGQDVTVDSSGTQTGPRRELYQKEETVKYTETFKPEFVYEYTEWDGPDGYKIVYSDKTEYAYASAKRLQDYFLENYNVTLDIVKDTQPGQEKEIVVGDTSRYKTSLPENEFAVILYGEKLIFEGGHFAMVEKAADWFMSVKPEKEKAVILSGRASDFKSSLDGGYKYVWGDEFDGTGLDYYKWQFGREFMAGTPKLYIAPAAEAEEKKIMTVEDGRMKITAQRYFNELIKDAEYATSEFSSYDKMGFLYGYAEIRARLPMFKGAWPAWWMTTAYCQDMFPEGYKYETVPYRIEVDIFEVFSSKTDVVPNFHKWWDAANKNNFIMPESMHSVYPSDKISHYVYDLNENISNEYHIYGLKWTPEEITMSVDGEDYMTFDLKDGFDGENEYNEFLQQPLCMVFTNYLYVDDLTSTSTAGKLIDPENLPAEFFIDYIRLYQIPGEGKLWTADI